MLNSASMMIATSTPLAALEDRFSARQPSCLTVALKFKGAFDEAKVRQRGGPG